MAAPVDEDRCDSIEPTLIFGMSKHPTHHDLTMALSAAGAAHHDYENQFLQGQHDEAWPGWYAAYALGRLGDFATPTLLARWLEAAPLEDDWADGAAGYVIEHMRES